MEWHIKTFAELGAGELYAILALRQEIFIVEQNCPYLDADNYDKDAIHIFATENNLILAYCRLLLPQIKYNEPSIGRVVVKKQYRGNKIGYELMERALMVSDKLFAGKGNRISAQVHLQQFYENCGFVVVSKPYDEDGIPHKRCFTPNPKTLKIMFKKLFLAIVLLCLQNQIFAQKKENKKLYTTTNFELIFSFADVDSVDKDYNNIVRFTCFFHLQEFVHWDFNKYLGVFSGGAIRNVGFIIEDRDIKQKFRSYSLGLPIGIKLGNFEKNYYLYAGGEIEYLFWFKQKTFEGNKKTVSDDWFGSQTNTFIPSVFAGIQFPKGINVKFKYYLDNFFNQDYTAYSNGIASQPYKNIDSRMFYVSVCFNLKNKHIIDRTRPRQPTQQAYNY